MRAESLRACAAAAHRQKLTKSGRTPCLHMVSSTASAVATCSSEDVLDVVNEASTTL